MEQSQREHVDLKNIQLRKVLRPEEVKKPIEHQKSGIVNEQSSVSALKNMFDPKARKHTMEESISKVEGEL